MALINGVHQRIKRPGDGIERAGTGAIISKVVHQPGQRMRIGRSHGNDTLRLFARVMLYHAVMNARAGDLEERAWLLSSDMAKACFIICEINPLVARLALIEQWRLQNGNNGNGCSHT